MKDLFPRYADPRNWPFIPCFFDRFMALAEGSRSGMRQVLARWFDLSAMRARKPKKPSYRPEIETLEVRTVPTLYVSTPGIMATAGAPIPADAVGGIAVLSDTNGLKSPDAYTISIAWGDGTTSPGWDLVVVGSANIAASHTYMQSGSFTVTISVTGDGGSGYASGTATVSAPGTAAVSTIANSVQVADLMVNSNLGFSDLTGAVTTLVSASGTEVSECGCLDPALGLEYNGDETTSTNPDGAVTTTTYDPTLHEITSVKDPLGNLTTYT